MTKVDALVGCVRSVFEHRHLSALDGVMSDQIELRPPTYGGSWFGRPLVSELIKVAACCLEDLRYTDVVVDGNTVVMRFEALVEERALTGVDYIVLDEVGQIVLFEIFSRPPKVASLLLEKMTSQVNERPELAAMMRDQKEAKRGAL